jgi:hypothetical protein
VALTLYLLQQHFTVCQLAADAEIPPWATGTFCSVTRTPQELSIVCESAQVPPGVLREAGWRAPMVEGPLAFSEVGILAALATPLARDGVAIFVIATFDTDYLLLKESHLTLAINCLSQMGHRIVHWLWYTWSK